MTKRFKIFIFIALCTSMLKADDAYHTYIRSQLAEQYGITGGQWLLPDTEIKTNSSIEFANISLSMVRSSGVETFNHILKIDVPDRRVNSWDAILRFPTTNTIQKSDVLLLVFWINNTDSLNRKHEITFDFEMIGYPDDRPLYLSHTIRAGWQQWFVPIQAPRDVAPGDARFQIHLGHMQGNFQLAGVSMLNFADTYTTDELPRSIFHLEYDGQEENAAWREMALYRIENIRKTPMSLKIVNKFDEPIEGARVSVNLLRHEFGFGSAISSDLFFENTYDARIYRQKLENLTGDGRSFNMVTLKNALKWPAWEDEYAWGSRDQARQVIQWFVQHGVRVRGHNLIWPDWQKMPDDLKSLASDPNLLSERIQNHIFGEVGFPGLKGYISEWDVLNELQNHDDLGYAFGSHDIYANCFQWAAAADPQAKLYLNENNILSGADLSSPIESIKTFIHEMQLADAPIHGLGVQGHINENVTPPEEVLAIFDELGELGVDLSITEYDAIGVDEHLAADYLRDVLIAAFSHPQLKNFIMWGFWDGAHWQKDSPIFRQDWSLKPSGRVFLDYVYNTWWTTDEGGTETNGLFQTTGFYGDYQVNISLDGNITEHQITLSRDQTEFILNVDTEQTAVILPDSFQLKQNVPNPFNDATSMTYMLPMDLNVSIELFDIRGRRVQTVLKQHQRAGRHTINIDGSMLNSGNYYVLLQSGNMRQVRKILLIK